MNFICIYVESNSNTAAPQNNDKTFLSDISQLKGDLNWYAGKK